MKKNEQSCKVFDELRVFGFGNVKPASTNIAYYLQTLQCMGHGYTTDTIWIRPTDTLQMHTIHSFASAVSFEWAMHKTRLCRSRSRGELSVIRWWMRAEDETKLRPILWNGERHIIVGIRQNSLKRSMDRGCCRELLWRNALSVSIISVS